jgi:hypothetical protein
MPTTFSSSADSGVVHWSLYASLLTGGGPIPTATHTPVSPTATPVNTPVPSTATATNTPVPPTPTATPTGSGVIRVGETNILSTEDSGNADLLIAQQTVLPQNATIQSLSFYVSGAGGELRLGLYADAGGAPGALQAQTASFTPVVGWNTQNVLTPVSLPAGTYWLAFLPQSNSLRFRAAGSGSARGYSYTFGAMPTTFSSSAGSGVVHWSLYASLLTDGAGAMIMASQLESPAEAPAPVDNGAPQAGKPDAVALDQQTFLPLVNPVPLLSNTASQAADPSQ